MKVICLCQDGNSRSVVCAYRLKTKYGIDALSCGWNKNSKETLEMLFDWADFIIPMQKDYLQFVPEKYHQKVRVVDVGVDRWFVLHIVTDLIQMIDNELVNIFGSNI